MLTENGLTIDQGDVDRVLANADVITIGFPTLAPRLLIDARSSDSAGPMAALVETVRSVEERYLWLGRNRGMFGAPREFTFFMWPHTIRRLLETGALSVLRRRLETLPGDGAAQLDRALSDLRILERDLFRAAIRGEQPWHTIWAAA